MYVYSISYNICCRLKSCENGTLFSATSISETISASTERVKRDSRKIELKTFDRPHRANDRKTT